MNFLYFVHLPGPQRNSFVVFKVLEERAPIQGIPGNVTVRNEKVRKIFWN